MPGRNQEILANAEFRKMKSNTGIFKKARFPLLIVALILIFSCRKEPDCYECTTMIRTTLIYEVESEVSSLSDTQKFCDRTEEEIEEYEI